MVKGLFSSPFRSMNKQNLFKICPFLHVGVDAVYNPLTNKSLRRGDYGFYELKNLLAGNVPFSKISSKILSQLSHDEWLVPVEWDLSRSFFLKYASIETHSVCNFSCRFCPVSLRPRKPKLLPTELFERIVAELQEFKGTLEGIIITSYNEPTLDGRFIDQVVTVKRSGLALAVLTNGSELTPDITDKVLELGGLRYLAVNLSTLNRLKFIENHGADLLDRVLGNLDYAKDRKLADEMVIVVLGIGDEEHLNDYREICCRFSGTRFEVKLFRTLDRAGLLESGLKPERPLKRLCGCENMGSRPLQHIHITAQGKCVLCCQDYGENYVVGDLHTQSIKEVLSGPKLAEHREFCYGLMKAPDDYICRKCVSAIPCP